MKRAGLCSPVVCEGESAMHCPRRYHEYPVLAITLDSTVQKTAALMKRALIRHLPVIDSGTRAPKELFSERDLRRHLNPRIGTEMEKEEDRKALRVPVHKLMVRRLVTANRETSIQEGAKLLVTKKIGCLPLLAENGRRAGIVTESDFIRLLAKKVAVVRTISKRTTTPDHRPARVLSPAGFPPWRFRRGPSSHRRKSEIHLGHTGKKEARRPPGRGQKAGTTGLGGRVHAARGFFSRHRCIR